MFKNQIFEHIDIEQQRGPKKHLKAREINHPRANKTQINVEKVCSITRTESKRSEIKNIR